MADDPLPLSAKAVLAGRIWATFLRVSVAIHKVRLPDLTRQLGRSSGRVHEPIDARRLGRIVERVLKVGPWRARCLLSALVLYRLLSEQGDDAELVIGMPARPKDEEAHAWVEIGGVDVGPPPGSVGHQALARFP